MPSLGVTGGIATGKSTFSRALASRLEADLFDADQSARRFLEQDQDVQGLLRREFGERALKGNIPNRSYLRQVVFSDPTKKRALEQILHPRIREEWIALTEKNKVTPDRWCIVDIPLLYETDGEKFVDRVVVVACSAATQLKRLQQTRKLPRELALQIMESQLKLELKMAKADHVVWNDGDAEALAEQTAMVGDFLIHHG